MESYIRLRKDGNGYSECTSPDALVGKGRCCHVLGENGGCEMKLSKIQRGMYEVKVNDSPMTIEAQKETIIKFFDGMAKLDDDKKNRIIEFLKDE